MVKAGLGPMLGGGHTYVILIATKHLVDQHLLLRAKLRT